MTREEKILSFKRTADTLTHRFCKLRNIFGERRKDLLQEAYVAMIRAIDEYDSERGTALQTYVWNRIVWWLMKTERKEIKSTYFGDHHWDYLHVDIDEYKNSIELSDDGGIEREERKKFVQELLDSVAFKHGYWLEMHYLDGHLQFDIAKSENVAFQFVSNTMTKVKKQIKEEFLKGVN